MKTGNIHLSKNFLIALKHDIAHSIAQDAKSNSTMNSTIRSKDQHQYSSYFNKGNYMPQPVHANASKQVQFSFSLDEQSKQNDSHRSSLQPINYQYLHKTLQKDWLRNKSQETENCYFNTTNNITTPRFSKCPNKPDRHLQSKTLACKQHSIQYHTNNYRTKHSFYHQQQHPIKTRTQVYSIPSKSIQRQSIYKYPHRVTRMVEDYPLAYSMRSSVGESLCYSKQQNGCIQMQTRGKKGRDGLYRRSESGRRMMNFRG